MALKNHYKRKKIESELTCTFCNELLYNGKDKIVIMEEKAIHTAINKSKLLGDDKWKSWEDQACITVHESCRKRYNMHRQSNKMTPSDTTKRKSSTNVDSTKPTTPTCTSETVTFNFSELCFFCCAPLDRYRQKVSALRDANSLHRILEIASREEDENSELITRLKSIKCPRIVTAEYHRSCNTAFFTTGKSSDCQAQEEEDEEEEERADTEVISGQNIHEAFETVCTHIEESGLFKFNTKDIQALIADTPLNKRVLFKKLKDKYGPDVYIFQHRGKPPVIYYKSFDTNKICSDWVSNDGDISEMDKKTILDVAAQIIRKDVKEFQYNSETYPPSSRFLDSATTDVPPLLMTFLGDLLLNEKKVEHEHFVKRDYIAHTIVSTLRPSSFISNVQLAVGTYVYRKTGSRIIIDVLSKLGICPSYYNLQLYEASTILDSPKIIADNTFVQYVFNNVDHSVSTMEGQKAFHCLGGLAIYTPQSSIGYDGGLKKCKKMPPVSSLASHRTIPIVPFDANSDRELDNVQFVSTDALGLGATHTLPPYYTGYLWGKFLKIEKLPTWKDFMETISRDTTYHMSHIVCLPFINEAPSDVNTLNSALNYTISETKKINQKTSILTVDQTLYLKTRSLVTLDANDQSNKVIVRLGGYHLLIAYFGAIGYTMTGSGIEDLWSTIYAADSIKNKLMTGHDYTRTLRAHILSFTALGMLILEQSNSTEVSKNFIHRFFEKWDDEPSLISDFNSDMFMQHLTEELVRQVNSLENIGPTAKLWVQYFKCVAVAMQYIEAELLGNWQLHLQSVEKMLPLFHAAGRLSYAKSAQIYLQDMAQLQETMDPIEYEKFTKEGFFTIRRADKPFSGMWPDKLIEQTLNRSSGTDLKQAKGVTPSAIARHMQGMTAAIDVMRCFEDFCQIKSGSGEHIDSLSNHLKRDNMDLEKMMQWFSEHNPFEARCVLMSLTTGLIGNEQMNCHLAVETGKQGMDVMVGENAENFTLSQTYKVKPLSDTYGKGKNANDAAQRQCITVEESLDGDNNVVEYEISEEVYLDNTDPRTNYQEVEIMELNYY